jgi:hypothetical protein
VGGPGRPPPADPDQEYHRRDPDNNLALNRIRPWGRAGSFLVIVIGESRRIDLPCLVFGAPRPRGEDVNEAAKAMSTDLFYPAPDGLPVPVRPPRGSEEIRRVIQESNWAELLKLADDSLVKTGALWLHGFLEEAHALAQANTSAEGSYWHALVHRSEGDFENSLYWYRRVGKHPIFSRLRGEVESVGGEGDDPGLMQELLAEPVWNPRRMVDLCRKTSVGELTPGSLLQRVAAIEFNLLMGKILESRFFAS